LPATVRHESAWRVGGIWARTDEIRHYDRRPFDDLIAEHDSTRLLGSLIVGRENHRVTEMLWKPESSLRYASREVQTG
jgi:hypothetical protein